MRNLGFREGSGARSAEYERKRRHHQGEEIVIGMLDDVNAEMRREIEILSEKHIESEDIRTRQIQMLVLIRGFRQTIHPPGSGGRQSNHKATEKRDSNA